jgi:hypothetical protein
MEYFAAVMEILARNTGNTSSQTVLSEDAKRKLGKANVIIVAVGINICIIISVILMISIFKDARPKSIYIFIGAAFFVLTLLDEVFILSSLWRSNLQIKPIPTTTDATDEIKRNLGFVLLFFICGIVPFVHLLFCPLTLNHCVNIMEISRHNPEYQNYDHLAKNFAMYSLVVFLLYTAALSIVITFGGVGAL